MNTFSSFFKGIDYFFKGLSFLFGKGLWLYMLYPMLLWTGLFAVNIFLTGHFIEMASQFTENYLTGLVAGKTVLVIKIDFLASAFSFIAGILFWFALWVIGGAVVKYLTLLLMSPMLSRLSEVIEGKISGRKFAFSFGQFMKDVVRGIAITLRNMCYEYLFILAGIIVSFIFPPLALPVSVMLVFISSYYYGFTMMDYSCERHKMSVRKGTRFIKQHKALICGIGFCLWGLYMLPTIIGTLIALIIGPTAACIAATLAFHDLRKNTSAQV
jgi:CysZ protein